MSVPQTIMDERIADADPGDELWSDDREVGQKGDSLYHTIPSTATQILSLTADDSVVVYVYETGYWVEVKDNE